MKSRTRIWFFAILLSGGLAGFVIGRASSGIRRVSGGSFLNYAAPEPAINSAFSATLVGTTKERVYLEYWSAVNFFGRERTVIWTPLSELPADVAQQLENGKNPWSQK